MKGKHENMRGKKWCNSGAHKSRVSPLFTCVIVPSARKTRSGHLCWSLKRRKKSRRPAHLRWTFCENTQQMLRMERQTAKLRKHESNAAEGYQSAQLRRATGQRANAVVLTYFIFAQNFQAYRHYAGNDGQRVGISGERSLKWDEKPVECLEWTFFGRERQRRRARYSLEHPCGGCLCIYMKSRSLNKFETSHIILVFRCGHACGVRLSSKYSRVWSR